MNNNHVQKYLNTKTISSLKSIEYIIIFLLIFICFIIILIILIRGMNKSNNKNKINPMIIEDVIKAYGNTEELTYNIPKKLSTGQYAISMWLYIEDFNYNLGNKKVIISDSYNNNDYDLVYLSKTFNNLVFNLRLFNNIKDVPIEDKECVLENIPIQKWNNVILILKNRTAEIYLDGRLSKVCYFENVPVPLNELKVLQGGSRSGFYGRISKLQFFNNSLGYDEIQDIFQNGPH